MSFEQRDRVLASIAAGLLRLDSPGKLYSGRGDGTGCDGCGEVIEPTDDQYVAILEDGRRGYRLHRACSVVWDVERWRRRRERAQETVKKSAELCDRADLLAREAEAAMEQSRRTKRGQLPHDRPQ